MAPPVSTAQICAPRRGVGSIAATLGKSAFLSAWYTVVTAPDANAFLHRALNSHTGQPLVRFLDGARSVLQFATLPIAGLAALLGKPGVTKISSLLVFANPPTLLLSALVAHDMANFVLKKIKQCANTALRYSPFPSPPRTPATETNAIEGSPTSGGGDVSGGGTKKATTNS